MVGKNAPDTPGVSGSDYESALRISREYKNLEAKLISILREVESAKVSLELGYSSTFEYAVEELKLSETNAYSFCRIARKSLFVPELLSEFGAKVKISNVHGHSGRWRREELVLKKISYSISRYASSNLQIWTSGAGCTGKGNMHFLAKSLFHLGLSRNALGSSEFQMTFISACVL